MLRWLALLLAMLIAAPASAHPVPFSYLDLNLQGQALTGTLTVHQYDLAHEYGFPDPTMAEDARFLDEHRTDIAALFDRRLHLAAGQPLRLAWTGIRPMPERNAIQLTFRASGPIGGKLTYSGSLFPYDPQHETFINIYDDGTLASQWIMSAKSPPHLYLQTL